MLDDQPGIEADEDDAALVDSFFLPGGIFDADEDEQETSVENTELSRYVRRLSTRDASRVPSNPWGDDQLQQNWTAAPSSILVTGINGGLSSTGLAIPPPPGYGGPRIEENTTSFDANQHDNNYMLASLPQIVQSPEAWKLSEFSQNGHHDEEATHQQQGHLLGTHVNGSQPPPGFQNRTIQRPSPGISAGTASSVDEKLIAEEGIENDISISTRIEDGSAKVGLRVPPNVHAAPLKTTNPYMAFLNDDDSSTSSSSKAENSHHRLVTKGSSSVATATEMDGNDLDEIDDVNFDENEVEEDNNGQEIDISGQEEAASLPFQSFSFDKESYGDDSIISSVSSSNDDSDPDDSRRAIHYLLGENQRLDEVTLALNSEVAVKLDITDSVKETDPPSTETMGKASQCKRFESGEPPTNRKIDRTGPRNRSTADSTALLSEERPLPKNGSSRGTISRENVDATQTNLGTILRVMDGRQVEWLQDLGEVLGAIAIALWKVLRRVMSFADKFITIGGLFLLHVWKYAIIEFLEERKVATCYSVFYFLPHFCSAVMHSILAPHWTPHIITTFSVWLLCTKLQNSVVIGDTLSFDMITSIGRQRYGQIQVLPSRRLRDDQTCHTILRILRYLLPFFLLIDGFSKEFGTIVGVSGASRLTAAFMMILVRKSLVSSPICWVSWAVQVLITTYHPASFLVDALVLVSGLSSIRLVRYLESQNYAGGTGQLRREKRY